MRRPAKRGTSFGSTREDHLEVHRDDKKVIEGHDMTFLHAGEVGIWTYFDDLGATPL